MSPDDKDLDCLIEQIIIEQGTLLANPEIRNGTQAEQLELWLQLTLAKSQYASVADYVLAKAFPSTPQNQLADMCLRNGWEYEESPSLFEVTFWKKE